MIRGEPKALDRAEIERRQPVWAALSELWLDTELSEEDLGRIAGVMRRSGYGLDELREIYLFEVAPVVSPSLLCLAGGGPGSTRDGSSPRPPRGRGGGALSCGLWCGSGSVDGS